MNAWPSRATRSSVNVDAIEERLERRVVDLHMPYSLGGTFGKSEGAAVKSLVELAHSRAVEEENLQRVAAARVEEKERAAAGVVPNLLLRNPR